MEKITVLDNLCFPKTIRVPAMSDALAKQLTKVAGAHKDLANFAGLKRSLP